MRCQCSIFIMVLVHKVMIRGFGQLRCYCMPRDRDMTISEGMILRIFVLPGGVHSLGHISKQSVIVLSRVSVHFQSLLVSLGPQKNNKEKQKKNVCVLVCPCLS